MVRTERWLGNGVAAVSETSFNQAEALSHANATELKANWIKIELQSRRDSGGQHRVKSKQNVESEGKSSGGLQQKNNSNGNPMQEQAATFRICGYSEFFLAQIENKDSLGIVRRTRLRSHCREPSTR